MARRRAAIIPDVHTEALLLDLLDALPVAGALHAWRVRRGLAVWIAQGVDTVPPLDASRMQRLEAEILTAAYDEALRLPLAFIARCMTPGAPPEPQRLPYACLCVVEWALARLLTRVAISFAGAAAALAGDRSVYAELAGRICVAIADPGAAPCEGR